MKIVRYIIKRLGGDVPGGAVQLLPLVLTIRVGGLLIAALAMWGFALIADDVLDKESQAIDTSVLLALRLVHTPLLDQLVVGLTSLGEPTLLLVICLVVGIWLLIRRRRQEAITIAIAAAGAGGLNYWLKVLFARARPALWNRIVDVSNYSFPSGHAMVSMVVYGIMGYLLAIHFPRWRSLIISLTILLIGGIGLTRLYLGVHWPTDVIAGYAAGMVWLIACILSLEIWQEFRSAKSREEDKSMSPEPEEQVASKERPKI